MHAFERGSYKKPATPHRVHTVSSRDLEGTSASYDVHVYHDLHPHSRHLLVPPEIYSKIVHLGKEYGATPSVQTLLLSIIGGMFVALGAATAFLVAGSLNQAPSSPEIDQHNYGVFKLVYSAVGYPFAFTAITACGADLFTSVCIYTAVTWMEREMTALTVLKIGALSWAGNFIGCVTVALLMHAGQIFDHHDAALIAAAESKQALDWKVIFIRAMFANMCVGIATWLQSAALDMTGKILAIWLPM
ncbi:Formate/nitrite transporter-domain-containing protein [Ochromonadaceae sp. CCMP2298]|nr:Formate/nitrite transporter-domain-containing protein [Ochromonadaceae sp. CCMP2298]